MATKPLPESRPELVLHELLFNGLLGQSVAVVAALGIADLLKDGPRTVEELASASSSQPDPLYRVLRALASAGVFAETEGRRFTLTPTAECLRSDSPNGLRNSARMFGLPLFWRARGELLHTVKTGEAGLKKAFGVDTVFEYFPEHPEDGAVFNDAMTDSSRNSGPATAEGYDFGRFRRIVDVGGGHGTLLLSILRRYEGPEGLIYDLPSVVKDTPAAIAAAGMSHRCKAEAGSFWESVPAGADGYLMKSITHGFERERATVFLKNVRRGIAAGGRLLLVDYVLPPGNAPSFGKVFDLQMLAVSKGGRERTEAEFNELVTGAGFKLIAVHPTATPLSIVECEPV